MAVSIRRALVRFPQSLTANEREFGAEATLCSCNPIIPQGDDDDLTSFYSCGQPIPDLLFNFDIAQDIVNAEFRSDFDDELLDWEMKKNLYYYLKKYPVYTESNEDLENFVDTIETNAIGKFYEVDLRMASLADTGLGPAQKELYRLEAISINNSVDDEFIFETNQKGYNELFLSTIFAGNYTLTTGQQSSLADIAEQCPYHGGTAVFLARGWYTTIDHEAAYDDEALCDPSPKLGTATSNAVAFELYPTLTAGQVLLQSLEEIEENMIITINNTLGEVVHRIPMVSSATTIDLERLPAGLYHLFVVKNKEIVFAEKFVKTTY